MRKILLASLAAVFTLGLMSSCSKDDDGPGPDLTDYAAKIAGIFKGDMTVALGEAQPGAPTTEKIYVTRTGENKVTMEIKNFTYEGMSLGNIEIKDVAVAATKATDASAAYKCAVTGKGTVSINLNGVPLTADVEVSGTVANDKADIKIVVDAAGLKVNVGFAGDKIGAEIADGVTGETRKITANGVFEAIGLAPDNEAFQNLVALDRGYVQADDSCTTSTPGIFTAGDCRTKAFRQITTACADGTAAALAACAYLQ